LLKGLTDLIQQLANNYGLPKIIANQLTIALLLIGLALSIISAFTNLFKTLIRYRNRRILNRNLTPYFSAIDVTNATKYYIPTKFQNVSPSNDEDPGSRYLASAKQELIPVLMKKIFVNSMDHHNYFLILADTGMGKTTFLINLYLTYKNSFHLPWQVPLKSIYLFPLGAPNILNKIANIKEKENSILLLDAFDEDVEAVKEYKTRLGKILEVVNEFAKIIITCRTQFFPSRDEEPHETGYYTYGDSGPIFFQKIYLSVFDNKDVERFLRKRFPLFNIYNIRSYLKARKIVKKCPSLVVRPMLLTYISEFTKEKTNFDYSYQLYEALIAKWIKRESIKRKVLEKFKSSERFEKLLYEFLLHLAWNIYDKSKERGGYFINSSEDFEIDGLTINELHKEVLDDSDKKTRSLLNRDADGKYKFSHKSIFEYFLAKIVFSHEQEYYRFNFKGMDATKTFFKEMVMDFFKIPFQRSTKAYLDVHTTAAFNLDDDFGMYYLNEFSNLKLISINVKDPFFDNIWRVFFWGKSFFTKAGSFDVFIQYLKINNFNELINYFETDVVESSIDNRSHSKSVVRTFKNLEEHYKNIKHIEEVIRTVQVDNKNLFDLLKRCNHKLLQLNMAGFNVKSGTEIEFYTKTAEGFKDQAGSKVLVYDQDTK
jgi:hypothetical protein